MKLTTLFGLEGRRALVTGAGRGIGRGIAEALAGAGAEICVHYHTSKDAAAKVADAISEGGGKAFTLAGDLTNKESADAMAKAIAEKWGALDILVNNAGDMIGRATLEDSSDEHIDRVLQVNLYSALRVTRAMIPLLRKGNEPSIVNLSSVAAHNGGVNGVSIYAASKGAIGSLTRSLAKELGPTIRVNAIAPGVIVTDLHHTHSTPEKLDAIAANTPLKRNGRADECGGAAVFLASAAGGFITGETIEVNGGLWLR